MLEVDFHHQALFLGVGGTVDELALWTGNKRAAPELYAACLPAGVGLMAHTVDGNQRKAVGHGMTALHGGPCLTLSLLFLRCVAALIADGSGINEQLGTLKGHQPGSLGIPLIPADEHAQPPH